MRILIFKSREEAISRAVCRVSCLLKKKPNSVLGLATGGTMEPVYQGLVERYEAGELSFAHATTFNLDEYVGLPPDHPQLYRQTMKRQFFRHIDLPPGRAFLPKGFADSPAEEAERYDKAIAEAGGIDLQLLGIGRNGHIGFNEPSSSLTSRTRVKRLSRQTLEDNRRFFAKSDVMPTHAITMGVGTILESKSILLVAFGSEKAHAVADMIEGPVSAICPASALQLHRSVTIVLDEPATGRLKLRDFYREIHPDAREPKKLG